MSESVRITLEPAGKTIEAPRGTSISQLLFKSGIEFPCGGRGRCKGCKVRITAGETPLEGIERELLSPLEQKQGWRLACHLKADQDMTLQAQQWDAPVLSDNTPLAFDPREGLGVAVDIGTTTVVAQLLDLSTGRVLAVQTALNPQAQYGADVMSRVEFAIADGGAETLRDDIRHCIKRLLFACAKAAECSVDQIHTCVLVGNTVMHHIFCDLDLTPLSRYPFESPTMGAQRFSTMDLKWWKGDCEIIFLPCIGGFVGSDILAGLLASGIADSETTQALVDIGTNGEMVVGNRDALYCAGTAAGPAFEGARISQGMRAAAGAISHVKAVDGALVCEVIGGGSARGICGSGLVDAVAAGLQLGLIGASGRLQNENGGLVLADDISLSQTDIRQLQLAKGAIAAGVRILSKSMGIDPEVIHLAGAFGNYVGSESAQAIGLLSLTGAKFVPAGNTALRGAKMALLQHDPVAPCEALCERLVHRSLSADLEFQDIYVDEMSFPEADGLS